MKKITKIFLASLFIFVLMAGIYMLSNISHNVVDAAEIPAGSVKDASPDIISVKDLTMNGVTGQTTLNERRQTTATWTGSNENGSVVFKFKYQVEDTNTSSSNSLLIYLKVSAETWNDSDGNALLIRGDGIFYTRNNGSFSFKQLDALTKGTHDIEFGRIALLSETDSSHTNQYYVYVKVDGNELHNSVSPYTLANIGNEMILKYGASNTKNTIYDADLTYENPQYLSISDMMNRGSGAAIGDSIAYVKETYLKFDTTNAPANHSFAFTAKIDSWVEGAGPNIYITDKGDTNNWNNAGWFGIRGTQFIIYLTDENGGPTNNGKAFNLNSADQLVAGQAYVFEYGRLAIMNGTTFTGKYHIYYKLNGNVVCCYDQLINTAVANVGQIHFAGTLAGNLLDVYTYETPKQLTISSLMTDKGMIGDSLTVTKSADYYFNNADHAEKYSLVIKFKYTNVNDGTRNDLHFFGTNDHYDKGSSFVLNNGSTCHLGKSDASNTSVGWKDISFDMTQGQTYDVEYGRLAQFANGVFTGFYKTYLKIDGNVIQTMFFQIPDSILTGNNVFITGADTNAVLQDNVPVTYETPDTIYVSDLKLDGQPVQTITLDQNRTYTYTATATHKSVVFKAQYEMLNDTSGNNSCQFHFSNTWLGDVNGGGILIRGDKNYIQKTGGGYVSKTALTAGNHDIEIGKLYITSGVNTGKYYIYYKADGNLVLDYLLPSMPDTACIFLNADDSNHIYDTKPAGAKEDTPTFTAASDGTKYTFAQAITNRNAIVEFDSSYETLQLDFRSFVNMGSRATNKYTSTGVKVSGDPTDFYHHTINLSTLTANSGFTGYESLIAMVFRTTCDYANVEVKSNSIYEAADQVSVSNLKYENGDAVGSSVTLNAHKTFTYTATATHKSVVYTFKYESVGSTDCQFHFCTGWMGTFGGKAYGGTTWVKSDKFFFYREGNDNPFGVTSPLTAAGTYKLEISKLYITDGSNAGKYYICVKVDDVIINDVILNETMPDSNGLFTTGSNGDKLIDINYVPVEYETADVISVSDLKLNGNAVGSMIALDSHKTYTYTATATHKSVVFKFKYEAVQIKDDKDSCQIHIGKSWVDSGCFWLRDDNLMISTSGGYNKGAGFTEAGVYNIEIGRLYITAGADAGKYYYYLKNNDVIISEYITSYAVEGNVIFTTGTEGNHMYDVNYVKPEYETADVVSVSDLKIDGNAVGTSLTLDSQKTFTYTATATHKSLVFKFKYEAVQVTKDKDSCQIHFGKAWVDSGCFWLRDDNLMISTAGGYNKGAGFTEAGVYNIEVGRLYITTGEDAGKYYYYLKNNDVIISEYISSYAVEANVIFTTGSEGNHMYDVNYVKPAFEEADIVTVKDLLLEGVHFGDVAHLDASTTYAYNATKEHKSVIYRFVYEMIGDGTDKYGAQFHFSDGWLGDIGGTVWIRGDYNYIQKTGEGAGYIRCDKVAPGFYNVEIGKVYTTAGENEGKYRVYLMIDGEVKLEYYVASMPDKANLLITGSDGNHMYSIGYVPAEIEANPYVNTWNGKNNGIEFSVSFDKKFASINTISEVGFYINGTKLQGKLVENGANYVVKAALANIKDANITANATAKFYYVIGTEKASQEIVTSLYDVLPENSDLKAKVLVVTVNPDTMVATGANKTGDENCIVLTGENANYACYIINGKKLTNNGSIMIGYTTYKTVFGANYVTLEKQDKKMMYGGSEHFVEVNPGHDEEMTAANLAPMTTELGLKTVRLDIEFGNLFNVTSANKLVVNYGYVAKVKGVINELKTNGGVDDFLAVLWTLLPHGYYNHGVDTQSQRLIAPNPTTEAEAYLLWLQLNGEAAKICAELFPEITNYETRNEPELMDGATSTLSMRDCTDYSVAEKALILTDLMYYYNKGLKETNPNIILTSPSLCTFQTVTSRVGVTSYNFLKALYDEINDNDPVTGFTEVDKNANNYFQVINIHPYVSSGLGTTMANWSQFVESFNTLAASYNDGGTEVWITEFGYSDVADKQSDMLQILAKADNIDCLTRFYFYKVHDYTSKIDNAHWGLYNYDCTIKNVGTAVKNYINPAQD